MQPNWRNCFPPPLEPSLGYPKPHPHVAHGFHLVACWQCQQNVTPKDHPNDLDLDRPSCYRPPQLAVNRKPADWLVVVSPTLQPFWKICAFVKLDHLPRDQGENKKYLKPPPRIWGTPKSSILIVFSLINHPFWGTTIFGNTHVLAEPPFLLGWGLGKSLREGFLPFVPIDFSEKKKVESFWRSCCSCSFFKKKKYVFPERLGEGHFRVKPCLYLAWLDLLDFNLLNLNFRVPTRGLVFFGAEMFGKTSPTK